MKITVTFDSMDEFEEYITSKTPKGEAIVEATKDAVAKTEEPEVKKKTVEVPVEGTKVPTAEDVRAKLNELAKEKGKEAVKELFKSFGAANFTKIKPEDYEAVLKAAEEGLNG